MTARRTAGSGRRRAAASGKKKAGKKKAGKKKASGKKPARKKRTGRKQTSVRSPRKPAKRTARKRSGARGVSLADRLTELVEHAAAGALRLVVEGGGREIAAWLPEAPAMRREAGAYLRELRELAGLTIDELADAVELRDRSLLEAVEEGAATLSFELILRLAAILARHDPVPFISRMVQTYNPVLWQLLEDWGVGRLPIQLAREHEFVNILRSHDEARKLSQEDFEQVIAFTRVAFETALHFAARTEGQASGDS